MKPESVHHGERLPAADIEQVRLEGELRLQISESLDIGSLLDQTPLRLEDSGRLI